MLKITIYILLLFFSYASYAQAVPQEAVPEKDPLSRSWVPIVGYNPTYRFFLGGGFFFEKRDLMNLGIFTVVTQDLVIKAETNDFFRIGRRWAFYLRDEIARGFEPNYGVGIETRVEDRVDIMMMKNVLRTEAAYFINPHFATGLVFEYLLRRNDTLAPADALREKAPFASREDTFGIGIHESLDYRNTRESPSFGWFQNLWLKFYPKTSADSNRGEFATAEGDLRFFQYILAEDLVMAYELAGGMTLGEPTYLTSFRLGGTYRLRGFFDNRFRGNKFYVQQSELRFPIIGAFSGATFIEFGEVTQTGVSFGNPALSYGFGLRIGLPPDQLAKIRLDVGFSRDQSGVFLDFGHAF